jgi:hypothetical protein
MDMHVGILIGAMIFGVMTIGFNARSDDPVSGAARIFGWGFFLISLGGLIGHWLS